MHKTGSWKGKKAKINGILLIAHQKIKVREENKKKMDSIPLFFKNHRIYKQGLSIKSTF